MVSRIFALSIIGWILAPAHGQQLRTLAEVLNDNSVPISGAPIPNLDAVITSYAALNDDNEFLIAYYVASPHKSLSFPLFLTHVNRSTGKWQHVAISSVQFDGLPGNSGPKVECLGSALNIQRNGEWYYVTLHLSPSAVCLLVLNRALEIHQALPGGVASFFTSGLLVYWGNMVHFAPVHPETLFLYDPKTRESKLLFPEPGDPLRKDFSSRLAKAVNNEECARNDWPCDPHEFSVNIGRVTTDDQTASLAFQATFQTEGFMTREEAEDSGKWDDDDYVYVYQLNPFRWREFSTYDLKSKFHTGAPADLLTKEKLEQVFATPEPK